MVLDHPLKLEGGLCFKKEYRIRGGKGRERRSYDDSHHFSFNRDRALKAVSLCLDHNRKEDKLTLIISLFGACKIGHNAVDLQHLASSLYYMQ
jgi:hypothetical protein